MFITLYRQKRCSEAMTLAVLKQEAQLPQRNSASAAHMEGGWG